MKKTKFVIFLLVIIILCISCIYIYKNYLINTDNIDVYSSNNINNNQTDIYEESNDINQESLPKYIDENPIKVGLYTKKSGYFELIDYDYIASWSPENVIGQFYILPTTETKIYSSSYKDAWQQYFSKYSEYENINNIRIGYNLQFTLNNGETINRNVLNPDDAYTFFPKVMVFLYDDIAYITGTKYYHITQDTMNTNTMCSSIKLVGDVESKNISSDIILTVFTFDTSDDFDSNNSYIGNSYYTITLKCNCQ